jgi:NitT/TauT family transport system substrate-binding protein
MNDAFHVSRSGALRTIGAAAFALPPLMARAADKPALRVGAEVIETSMEAYYADEQGFYTHRGLTVATQSFANNSVVLEGIIANQIDIGNTDLIVLANAFNRGVDVAIVAGGALHATESVTLALCVSKNSRIRNLKELEGTTIAVPTLRSVSQAAVAEWLRRGGVNPANVKFFEMPFPAMTAALQRGIISAALNGEPFITDGKADTRVFAIPTDVIAPHYYSGVWYGKREVLDANAAAVRTFTDAIYDTARWANAHHADTAAILAEHSKMDLQRISGMARVQFSTSLGTPLAQPLLDFAAKYNLLEKPVAAGDMMWKRA